MIGDGLRKHFVDKATNALTHEREPKCNLHCHHLHDNKYAKQNKMQQTRKKEKKNVDLRVAEGERDMHGEVSQE